MKSTTIGRTSGIASALLARRKNQLQIDDETLHEMAFVRHELSRYVRHLREFNLAVTADKTLGGREGPEVLARADRALREIDAFLFDAGFARSRALLALMDH